MQVDRLDVNELSRLSVVGQAQAIEEAERRLDDLQRGASNDPEVRREVESMRRQIREVQRKLYGC